MSKIKWRKKGAKGAVQNDPKEPIENTEETVKEEPAEEQAEPQPQPETAAESAADEAAAAEAGAAEWEAALRTAVAQRDEYLQLAQRTQADFANFRRRNQTVRADAYDDGVRETVAAFLPVLDNLERAAAAVPEDEENALASGVRMTLKQLLAVAAKLGLEEVSANPGDPFDPEVHNAVMRGEGGEPGTVMECFEKGYRVKGRMIRYASVKVCADD